MKTAKTAKTAKLATVVTVVTVPFTGHVIKLPASAGDWEIYSGMAGAGLAAHRLTKALAKALLAPTRDGAISIMQSALTADRKYGAWDTEPRSLAEEVLSKGRSDNFTWAL